MFTSLKIGTWNINITICKIDSQWELAVCHRELNPVLCDNLEGWDGVGGGREVQDGGDKRVCCCSVAKLCPTHVYLGLIHVDVWQKPIQHCKAIILQWKINQFLKIWTIWNIPRNTESHAIKSHVLNTKTEPTWLSRNLCICSTIPHLSSEVNLFR